MKCLWRSKTDINNLSNYAQITDIDGDCVLEVLIPKVSFFGRVKLAMSYIFRNKEIVFSRILLDEDIQKIGSCYNDRQDSKGK